MELGTGPGREQGTTNGARDRRMARELDTG